MLVLVGFDQHHDYPTDLVKSFDQSVCPSFQAGAPLTLQSALFAATREGAKMVS